MADIRDKIKKMPKFVQDMMASSQSAEINGQIGAKYNLSDEEIGDMVGVIVHTILKDISLKDFPKVLEKKLRLSPSQAKPIALDIALKRFLPLKKHLPKVKDLIISLGGQVPEEIPKQPTPEPKPFPPPSPPPQKPAPQKKLDIKTALEKNPEIGKQLITNSPIKLGTESVKPSIKNWLADYVEQLGTGWHSSIERSKYLFRSPNTQGLSPKERIILSQILKSYDQDSPLPTSEETGLLALPKPEPEEKEEKPPEIPKVEAKPKQSFPIRPPQIPSKPERPPKPEETKPKIKGNVVDLKKS